MLRACQSRNRLAAMQGNRQIDVRKHFQQELMQCFNVFRTVRQNLFALFSGERPALQNAFAYRVFVLGCNAIETEIL